MIDKRLEGFSGFIFLTNDFVHRLNLPDSFEKHDLFCSKKNGIVCCPSTRTLARRAGLCKGRAQDSGLLSLPRLGRGGSGSSVGTSPETLLPPPERGPRTLQLIQELPEHFATVFPSNQCQVLTMTRRVATSIPHWSPCPSLD